MSKNYCHGVYKSVKNSFKKKSFQVKEVRFVPDGDEKPLTSAEVEDILQANGGMFKKVKAQKRPGLKKSAKWKLVPPLYYGAFIEKKNVSNEDAWSYLFHKRNGMDFDPNDEEVARFKEGPGYVYFMRINREDYPHKDFYDMGTERPVDHEEWIVSECAEVDSDVVVGEFNGVF